MVKVHCGEGVATHTGPESCVVDREGGGEALTGARIGQPLSGENPVRSADALEMAEGNTAGRASASARAGSASSETLACTYASCTGTGRSPPPPWQAVSGAASGRPKVVIR